MLVMSHREGEVLEIGPDIRIYIKRVKGRWVRLGIEAPRDVVLNRVRASPEDGDTSDEADE
jgi:carbon storage regulator